MLQIFCHRFARVHEELSFGFKVAQLKDQVHRHRDRMDTVDQVMFSWTQSEVEAAVLFCKVWQAVKIIDLLGSQDRQAMGFRGHVPRTLAIAHNTTLG